MIRRLLCHLGFHHWDYQDSPYGPYARCRHCPEVRG